MALKKARINIKGLKREAHTKAKPILAPFVHKKALVAIERAKNQLIEEFANHLITQEVDAGSGSTNISDTLGGVGNLFSYIGFDKGDDPITPIKRYLKRALKLKRISGKEGRFILTIELPSMDDIEGLSPVPWAPGKSWIDSMERGLSGLGQYLLTDSSTSRAGGAIQVEGEVRPTSFQPQSYLSPILENIRKNIFQILRS